MLDFSKINDNSIIILSNDRKESILKGLGKDNSLKHIKYLSKEELINGLGYSYDYEALMYLNSLNYSFENAKEILDNINLIEDKGSMHDLALIKNDLIEKELIKKDLLFKRIFSSYPNLYIYGYSQDDLELKRALDSLNISYSYIEDEIIKRNDLVCDLYHDIDTEVMDMCTKIASLIEAGVNINSIYLYKIPDEYKNSVRKVFKFFNYHLAENEALYLMSSPLYLEFINNLKTMDINEAYNTISKRNISDDLGAMEILANIIIDTVDIEKKYGSAKRLELISYLAKNKRLKRIRYENEIKTCNSNNIISDTEHVFMLGFSNAAYPRIYKDDSLISDSNRNLLGLNTSRILSGIEENNLVSFILNTKNIHISFNKGFGKSIHYESTLISKLNIEMKEASLDSKRYSKAAAYFEVSRYKDLKNKYDIDNEYIDTFNDDKEFKYSCFNHQLHGLENYENEDALKLSYSSIDEYYGCPYKYFINHVLKGKDFDETFYTKMGTYFHKVLEISLTNYLNDNNNVDINWDSFKEDYDSAFITGKERFFINMLSKQIDKVHKKNIDFLKNTGFSFDVLLEEKIDIPLDTTGNTTLTGSIDKALIDKAENKFIVVDYKTGNDIFKPDEIEYGKSMQLLVYAKAMQAKYPNSEPIGFYINNILEDKKTEAKNPDNAAKHYNLNGKTLKSASEAIRLDSNVTSGGSLFIAGLKINNDGTVGSKYKVIEKDEIINLMNKVNENIDNAIKGIRKGIFPVSPFSTGGDDEYSLPCKFCGCKDICFMEANDIRKMPKKDDDKEDDANE